MIKRTREGLTDDVLLFPRAKTAAFDNAVARAWDNRDSKLNLLTLCKRRK